MTKESDELQKARADWLDALSRENALQGENLKLTMENHELRMKLAVAQTQAAMFKGMNEGFVLGYMGKRS